VSTILLSFHSERVNSMQRIITSIIARHPRIVFAILIVLALLGISIPHAAYAASRGTVSGCAAATDWRSSNVHVCELAGVGIVSINTPVTKPRPPSGGVDFTHTCAFFSYFCGGIVQQQQPDGTYKNWSYSDGAGG
jgi:hypothetical protein